MDTLTHALSGALLARATAPRAAGAAGLRLRVLAGGAAAAFPDADMLLTLASPLTYLTQHRGITHSLLLLPLWAWLIAWAAARLARHPDGARAFFAVAALGIGIHIAGDLITAFGTMILAPLSDRRFALGTTFIIDLWFSGILLAGLLASAVWRGSRWPAATAGIVLAAYVGLQWTQKSEAIALGRAHAQAQGVAGAVVDAMPRPTDPFRWTVIVAGEDAYHVAHIDLLRREPRPAARDAGLLTRIAAVFRPAAQAHWERWPLFGDDAAQAALARYVWSHEAFAFYRWFAAYPALLAVERGNPSTCVWFRDLRFLMPGRAEPFRFGLCAEDQGEWRLFQLAADGSRRALP